MSQKARLQGKPVADPFIIACAKIKDGCVITEEALKPNAPKIPTVCQHFSIDCSGFNGARRLAILKLKLMDKLPINLYVEKAFSGKLITMFSQKF